MALTSMAIAVFGGLAASIWNQSFELRWPSVGGALRRLCGGALMGGSAAIIPGGNGTMLVYGVPSLAPHALAAYAAMTVVLCASFLLRR